MKTSIVHHIAQLAHLTVSPQEEVKFGDAFDATLKVISKLSELDVKNVEPTHQVTGLTNILRDDVIDEKRMFTQEEALSGAKKTHQGFFVVEQIIEQNQ